MPSFQYPKLELKYCERCGGLWLRPQGAEAVYCASCADAISELPPVAPRGGKPPGSMHAAGLAPVAAAAALVNSSALLGGTCA
jgi:hypothetical protein